MKKQSIFTIFIIVSILSAFSILSMIGRFDTDRISKTSLSQNKKNLICSAQGDIRPPAWDEDDDKTTSGS